MKIQELTKEEAQQQHKALRTCCTKVMVMDSGHNHYDAYFAQKGKYAGLSILAKTSEGSYYYCGPCRSVQD